MWYNKIEVIPYFYPRSPRGERLSTCEASTGSLIFLSTLPARGATQILEMYSNALKISIHAPREGSDPATGRQSGKLLYFYPRSPRGERRLLGGLGRQRHSISIHAPREGSDGGEVGARPRFADFYPRSPRGERQETRLLMV